MSTLSRRTKWRPTPSPLRSPMILHFPRRRRTRRRNRGNLENGLGSSFERRERVKEREDEQEGHNSAEEEEEEEEKWRFRAECDLLRMEREKLEKNSINLQKTLRSAVQTLVSARKKIVEGGKNTNAAVLEEEIEDLSENIEELQRVKGKLCVNEIGRIDNKSSENKCSGRCKAMVLRVAEQVRAETEQWSQMQRMLEKVRGEMEELHQSRHYWECQAHNSNSQIQSLRHTVEQWKEKALDYKQLVSEIELELELANQRGDNLKKEEKKDAPPPPLSLAKQLAKEKRSFIRSLKENRHAALDKGSKKELSEDGTRRRRRRPHSNSNGGAASKRSPLRDIVNSSLLPRENHRIAFDYHSPESSRIRESFRK